MSYCQGKVGSTSFCFKLREAGFALGQARISTSSKAYLYEARINKKGMEEITAEDIVLVNKMFKQCKTV